MFTLIAALALLAQQSVFPTDPSFPADPCQATRPIDGLLNGDFELDSPCTSMGQSHGCGQSALPGPFADGGFWIGAEGMTASSNGTFVSGRHLRIRPQLPGGAQLQRFVYQRVGAPAEFTSLTELAARVRIHRLNDEARVTLAEPDGDAYSLWWFLGANQNTRNYKNFAQGSSVALSPDHPDALWHITEENGSSSAPMCWFYSNCGPSSGVQQPTCGTSGVPVNCHDSVAHCENFVGFFREHSPLVTCPPAGTSSLEMNEAFVQARLAVSAALPTKIVATFEVPRSGCVRLGTRLWAPSTTVVGARADASFEIVHITSSGSMPIRCGEIVAGDSDGIVVLDRMWVDEGDRIQFKIGKLDPALGMDLFFDPSIVYEGRRLTYRIARSGSSLPVASSLNPDERFQTRFVADNKAWHALTFAAGADWSQFWSTPPMPPLEIELSSPPPSRGAVDFDDVQAFVHYCDATPDELAREIESYFGWSRQISALQRDRGHDAFEDPAPPNPDAQDENRRGPLATPYELWSLRAKSGKAFAAAAGEIGAEPEDLWGRLQVDFDATDYADMCWLREQEWFHRNLLTGRVFSEYDCFADVLTGLLPNNGCQASGIGDWISFFARTRDVTALRLAATYAQAAAKYGVNSNDDLCDAGLIGFEALPACGGPPPPFDASPRLLDALNGTAQLVRVYCAAKRWSLEHPSSTYFADADFELWMRAARESLAPVDRRMHDYFAQSTGGAALCTDDTPCDGTAWSSFSWHNLPGTLDDSFGYLAADASAGVDLNELIAFEQQLALAPTEDELEVSSRLNCIVDSGVTNLLPPWFEATVRSDPNAADQGRGWLYFLPRAATPSACDPSVTAGDQLVLASKYWTKFQFRGTWLNSFEMQLQLVDLVGAIGQAGLAPHYYVEGMLLAAQVASPSDAHDLRDQLYTILRATRLAYRDAWGLQFGYALRPFGWAGYAPNLNALTSGFQQRTVDALLGGVALAGWNSTGVQRAAPPRVFVDPPSLVAEPTVPTFSFCVQLPGQTDAAVLQAALEQHTEIGWWHETPAGWEYQVLWPLLQAPAWVSFSAPMPCTSPDSIGLVLGVQPGFANPFKHQTFKLDIHAWDADGQWDRDTSFQQW